MLFKTQNLDLIIKEKDTQITVACNAGSAVSVTVANNAGAAANGYCIIGKIPGEQTELVQISSVSGNTTIVFATLKFAHGVGTLIYFVDYNQVEFSRAITKTGTKTVLTTKDITPDEEYTLYDDTTNTTGYGFIRFKNSTTVIYSAYSDPMPYEGYGPSTVRVLKDGGLEISNEEISNLITEDFLLNRLNDWQDEVSRRLKRWSWLQNFDYILANTVQGQHRYALPLDIINSLTSSSALKIKIADRDELIWLDKPHFDKKKEDCDAYTTVASDIGLSDTSISLTDASDFDSSGSINIEGDEIAYTGKTGNTLTGVTGIDATHGAGVDVWQSSSHFDEPDYFTCYGGYLFIWPPPDSGYSGKNIYLDYYKKVTRLDSDADETAIPHYELAKNYLAMQIKVKKQEFDNATVFERKYKEGLAILIRAEGEIKKKQFRPMITKINY